MNKNTLGYIFSFSLNLFYLIDDNSFCLSPFLPLLCHMRNFNFFFFLFFPLLLSAQNHTANSRRNPNERNDTLSAEQIAVFSRILDNMVFVDGGSFFMGRDDSKNLNKHDNEPRHLVNIDPFFISKFEVTQDIWAVVMGDNPSAFKSELFPVENISWNDALEFIGKLNNLTGMDFRMPTEAEWEFAARGGKYSLDYQFAGSDFLKAVAWYKDNSQNSSHEVGKKRPNELGIFDMSGNVAEWCSDFYDFDYYKTAQTDNPKGPLNGLNKVNRGGSWLMEEIYQRVDARNVASPDERNPSVGLRLAM